MHSRNGLLVLTAVAAVLVAMVIIDTGTKSGPVVIDRRIVPEVARAAAAGDAIDRISWQPADDGAFSLVRDSSGEWKVRDGVAAASGARDDGEPAGHAVNPALVDAIEDTLELLAYVRSFDRATLAGEATDTGLESEKSRPKLTVTIELATGATVVLQIGDRIAATDRVWLSRKGRSAIYLIEGYAARLLDVRSDDLRQRRIFRLPPEAITGLEIRHAGKELVLRGQPPEVHAGDFTGAGGYIRADPAAYDALVAALADITIARFGATAWLPGIYGNSPMPLSIRQLGGGQRPAELYTNNRCDPPEAVGESPPGELIEVHSSVGSGCVATAALQRIRDLTGSTQAMFARQLLTRGRRERVRPAPRWSR